MTDNPRFRIAADNRKARYNFEIVDAIEAGLVLTGTEVKALRGGKATIAESYATIENGELMLVNSYIPEYLQANRFNHEPKRPRKLLASKKQIARFAQAIEREGMTLIPLKVYFNEKGRAKIEVAIARGKKLHDKRESEKERDWKREQGRLLRDRG
ncbi:MAG: SsrA-binding protein SmpB [Methylobacterium sp.]|jgi:SsrA-binding protein|uniref:SsrA-binding protein SmpB n=1 Tax=Rhabdaerophilum sp. TaxID=2717341 RepID=UPI002A2236F9|nr:SsrA-binding protein SmpB [Methylobacterium sp.]MCE2933880.1 SsrA-binding protein SmpB [Hyphomicrobiales bacterium]MCA3634662.1 SsrA-binding protein SmpB [Methylobacterium sp.]MCA3639248.1 SsrA-binding protein SmpB [Methylobacterium sp.]MCA3642699.1 SsrA-binding protein SmpB [Methylobacterium sp.]